MESRSSLSSLRAVWLSGVVGVALSISLAAWFWGEARRLDRSRFNELTHRLTEDLDTQTEKIEAMLRELSRMLGAQREPSMAAWDDFMNQVSPAWNFPGVTSIGYATNQSAARVLEAIEPWLRVKDPRSREAFYQVEGPLAGPRRWSVWTVDVFRVGVSPTARFRRQENSVSIKESSFQSARFREPEEGPLFEAECPFSMGAPRERVFGVVYESLKANHLQDSVARDDLQIREGLFPLQKKDDVPFPQATMLVPVAHPRRLECWERLAPKPDHSDEPFWLRWQLNEGLIFACLDFSAILAQIHGDAPPEVEVEIYSRKTPTLATWMNPNPSRTMRANRLEHQAGLEILNLWAMYSDKWALFFYTTPQFARQSTRMRAWWAGGIGLVMTALFCRALGVQMLGRLTESRRASELKEARDALLGAHKERERLSHDLHDGAIQSLYAIQLGLTRAGRAVEERAPDTAQTLQESRLSLDAVIGELRGFITEMKRDQPCRPSAGLGAVLDSIVRRLRPASAAPIELECDPLFSERLSSAQALQLAAIAREALSNSLRHSHAQHIAMRLTGNPSAVVLEIIDDGIGFDEMNPASGGIGLDTMRRRTADLGGKIGLYTSRAGGTRIRVEVPLATGQGLEARDD